MLPWLAKSAEFDESKHPRDHGKFSSKPGATGESSKPASRPKKVNRSKQTIQQAAVELAKHGYSLKIGEYDLKNRQAMYHITDRNGKTTTMPVNELKTFMDQLAASQTNSPSEAKPTSLIDRISNHLENFNHSKIDPKEVYASAKAIIDELDTVPTPKLYPLLQKAGIDAIKPSMSRAALLQRTLNKLTAVARAIERAEV